MVLGVNFLENTLSLFDLDTNQICMREIALPAAGKYTKIYYPYSPKVFHKWGTNAWWYTLVLVGATALITLVVICITSKPVTLGEKEDK